MFFSFPFAASSHVSKDFCHWRRCGANCETVSWLPLHSVSFSVLSKRIHPFHPIASVSLLLSFVFLLLTASIAGSYCTSANGAFFKFNSHHISHLRKLHASLWYAFPLKRKLLFFILCWSTSMSAHEFLSLSFFIWNHLVTYLRYKNWRLPVGSVISACVYLCNTRDDNHWP